MQNIIYLGANNPVLVGRVVGNLAEVGYAVIVEGEIIAGTLLARIEFSKPVNAEAREAKKAWAAKLEAAKNEARGK